MSTFASNPAGKATGAAGAINPKHYDPRDKSGVACCVAQRAMLGEEGYRAYLAGMIVKYTWRYNEKAGIEDLHKAKQCADMLIAELSVIAPVTVTKKMRLTEID